VSETETESLLDLLRRLDACEDALTLLAARSELKSSVAPAVPTTGRLQCPDCAAARDQLASVRSQLQLAFAWNASEGDRLRTELQKAHAELRKRINPEADMICASVLP